MNKAKASVWILAVTAAAVCAMAAAAAAEEPPARVETCRVELACVEQTVAMTGQVRYAAEYAAISTASGVVEQVYVRPGEQVVAGQALFRLADQGVSAAVSTALSGSAPLGDELLRHAAAQLESLTIRAAAEGLVQQVNVVQHGGVMAGEPAVLLSSSEQQIHASVVLRDAQRLQPGMKARIRHNGECIDAWVREIGPAQVSGVTGQTVCQVTIIPARTMRLPLGAQVEAEVVLAQGSHVPTLPVEVISDEGNVMWVADGRCYEIPVQMVLDDGMLCWVELPVGTEVVCGGEMPAHGQRVEAGA